MRWNTSSSAAILTVLSTSATAAAREDRPAPSNDRFVPRSLDGERGSGA
jgi:hypothetical protein